MIRPLVALSLSTAVLAQASRYQPCPLLGPYLPPPQLNASSPVLAAAFDDFTSLLDQYIAAGDGDFGPITPNTTSFSLALFAGSNYVPKPGDETPLLYEYHHAATSASDTSLDASSKFAIGDLTQMFTALTVLLEMGDKAWSESIVEFIPELKVGNSTDSIEHVRWEDVTLGALASHLAGIARDSDACHVNEDCTKDTFLQSLTAKPPVELPDSTPIFSHAAFQLLALAVEAYCRKPFSAVFLERIVRPLQLNSTAFLTADTTTFGNGLANATIGGEPASLGLTSSILDLSTLGRALLTSNLLDAAEMRRWLKPVSSTSNLRNAVGRPWEIYHYSDAAIDPIIDVYTKTGNIGRSSAYFGLVPSVDIGFTILAVDTVVDAPDLNAYADIALAALVQIQDLGYKEANATTAGSYKGSDDASISLRLTGSDPGIAVTHLLANGTDWLEIIAKRAGMERLQDLDLRLYPTGLEEKRADGGRRQVFQGVVQDTSALVDAGTPTCISWQTVGEIELNGSAVDRFIMGFGEGGAVEEILWEAGGVMFRR